MKTLLLILVLLQGSIYMHAQQVTYKYDAAGNRTERVIDLSLRSSAQSSELTPIEDAVSNRDIKIYPNPTQGALAVELPALSGDATGEITLFDTNGRTVDRKQATSGLIHFDLSGQPSGIYLMKITLNGESITWKIIKE